MNSVKLQEQSQICKNQLHFYILTTNSEKRNYGKNIYNIIKKEKILRNKFNQGSKRFLHYLKLIKPLMKKLKETQKDAICVHGLE